MPFVYLVRHGENDYVKQNRIAGRTPGVHLNEKGREQAQALVKYFGRQKIDEIYSSPLERAVETIEPAAEALEKSIQIRAELNEMDYGEWQGQYIPDVRKTALWKTVQQTPSRAVFPGGEIFGESQLRICRFVDRICSAAKPNQRIVCVSHGDMIKLTIASYIGLPLDAFQHINVSPGSISILNVQKTSAMLLAMNLDPGCGC